MNNSKNPRSEWADPKLVQTYSQKAASPTVNWFEYEVNLPATLSLIPKDAQTILDFGCGAGDITALLAESYKTVEGCDPSSAMLSQAHKDFPSLTFFEWDGANPLNDKMGFYDVVFSKLAVHFIEELQPVASQLCTVLKQGGSLIFSVPHPLRTMGRINGASYWQQTPYREEIGSYGITVTMIHRSLQDYVTPFTSAGFVLSTLSEPEIPTSLATKYNASERDRTIPKRLNLRFTKPTDK